MHIQRGRSAGKGAATPYLAELCGARIAICDEAGDDAALDEEIVKRMTGEGKLEGRMLFQNNVSFNPTHLPILLANNLPKIDYSSFQHASQKRSTDGLREPLT